jgi:uncharacterized protein (DUF2062 family)
VLGIALAFILNLNRVAVILGVYSNLPWILPAYYTLCTVAGAALLGLDVPPDLVADLTTALRDFSWSGFRSVLNTLSPLLWAYTIGSTLGALALSGAAYRISLAMIEAHHRHKRKAEG